jgi:hypothetical protein
MSNQQPAAGMSATDFGVFLFFFSPFFFPIGQYRWVRWLTELNAGEDSLFDISLISIWEAPKTGLHNNV